MQFSRCGERTSLLGPFIEFLTIGPKNISPHYAGTPFVHQSCRSNQNTVIHADA